jgi:hypothetical protein
MVLSILLVSSLVFFNTIKSKSGKIIENEDNISINNKWNEYLKFMEQFYYLDKQDFNNITCKIKVSIINNTLSAIKVFLKSFKNSVKIEENIDKFTLNFNSKIGLTFDLPIFEIKIISEEKIANPTQVKTGINQMKKRIC